MKVTIQASLLIPLASVLLSSSVECVPGGKRINSPQKKIQEYAQETDQNEESQFRRTLQETLPLVSAVASSQKGNRIPDNAIDEDLFSRWTSMPTNSEWIYVKLDRAYQLTGVVLKWGLAYGKDYDIEVSDDATNWVVVAEIRDQAAFGFRTIPLASQPTASYVRINGINLGTQIGYSLCDIKVQGFDLPPTTPAPTPIPTPSMTTIAPTQGSATLSNAKIVGASASSTALSFNGRFKASNVYDGRSDTSWACARRNDKEWIQVELDRYYPVRSVVLNWGSAYGKNYNIETWDGSAWIIAARVRDQTSPGILTIKLNAYPLTRYVRIKGKIRGTPHCYSLYEITVQTGNYDSTPMPVVPTQAPKTSDSFRMRLHWQEGYVWQQDPEEKFYCMSCFPECYAGALARIENCSFGTTRWQFVFNSDNRGDQIKVSGTNLCIESRGGISLEGRSRVPISLQSCDILTAKQRWEAMLGSFKETKFDIRPAGQEGWCLSQPHHPKEFETVYMLNCTVAHNSTTGFWTKY